MRSVAIMVGAVVVVLVDPSATYAEPNWCSIECTCSAPPSRQCSDGGVVTTCQEYGVYAGSPSCTTPCASACDCNSSATAGCNLNGLPSTCSEYGLYSATASCQLCTSRCTCGTTCATQCRPTGGTMPSSTCQASGMCIGGSGCYTGPWPYVASGTVSGTVTTFNNEPVNQRAVTVTALSKDLPTTYGIGAYCNTTSECPQCRYRVRSTTTVPTQANGTFSAPAVSVTADRCQDLRCVAHRCDEAGGTWHRGEYEVVVSTFGSETPAVTRIAALTPPNFSGVNVIDAPDLISPNGMLWARRVGPLGPHPILDIEGFDPLDEFTSDARLGFLGCSLLDPSGQACDLACLSWRLYGPRTGASCSIQQSRLCSAANFVTPSNNLATYIVQNGYTLWELLLGDFGGASMKGSTEDGRGGLAYQSMMLAKSIADRSRGLPNYHGMVVGGYSQGGSIARVGLRKWCAGDWSELPVNCPDVSLWWAGDAPLEGGVVPVALQRYVRDADVTGNLDTATVALMQAYLDSNPAREMMQDRINNQLCDTGCGDGFLGINSQCESHESYFREDCNLMNDAFVAFQGWARGTQRYPMRNGGWLSGVAFTPGMVPGERPGFYPTFFYTTIGFPGGDHTIRLDTSRTQGYDSPLTENVNGSLDTLAFQALDGMCGTADTGFPFYIDMEWDIAVHNMSTRHSTTSSLDWGFDGGQHWLDYTYNPTANGNHTAPFPTYAGRMMMGYIHEYLKGNKDRPICTAARSIGRKPGATCRTATAEVCNGRDDDGDELIDELLGKICQAAPTEQ